MWLQVERRDPLPYRVLHPPATCAREAVDPAADQVAQRVARQREQRQEGRVDDEDHAPEAEPRSALRVERERRVDPQEEQRDEREVQEVAVEVLEDERERRLHPVALVDGRLTDGAAGRIGEVEAVVGLAVVVAGRPEAQRDPQDQETRTDEPRQPGRRDQRREEGRQIAVDLVRRPEQRRPHDPAKKR